MSNAYDLAKRGEIVSTVSPLAMDEDVLCRKCSSIFTLSDAVYQETDRNITKHGFKCPSCGNINYSYVKTPKLLSLEKRIAKAPMNLKEKARRKYQREFQNVQKRYEMV